MRQRFQQRNAEFQSLGLGVVHSFLLFASWSSMIQYDRRMRMLLVAKGIKSRTGVCIYLHDMSEEPGSAHTDEGTRIWETPVVIVIAVPYHL